MADDHVEESKTTVESVMDKTTEKFQRHDSSSSSDSDNEKSSPSSLKSKISRMFGREKPVHQVLGGGKRMIIDGNIFFINPSFHFPLEMFSFII